jgi:predicted RNase H-like nuclease
MSTLLVGFDSAWTASNSGAIAGCVRLDDGSLRELGEPGVVGYPAATDIIVEWQRQVDATSTLVLLDQPTIVKNAAGQRPVENIVSSAVSLRYGGMQPANTARTEMFGADAPLWRFLARFGGAADPCRLDATTAVLETYPVLLMIAMGWMLPDRRPTGRLPKYNPERRKTFSLSDWRHVCGRASAEFRRRGLPGLSVWTDAVAERPRPQKSEQDRLDACLCLLVAIDLAAKEECLMIGNVETGYIVVRDAGDLREELAARCVDTGRAPADWLRLVRFGTARARQPTAGLGPSGEDDL